MIPDNKGLIQRDHVERNKIPLLRDKWLMSPNKVWIMLGLIKGQDAAKQFSLILQPPPDTRGREEEKDEWMRFKFKFIYINFSFYKSSKKRMKYLSDL